MLLVACSGIDKTTKAASRRHQKRHRAIFHNLARSDLLHSELYSIGQYLSTTDLTAPTGQDGDATEHYGAAGGMNGRYPVRRRRQSAPAGGAVLSLLVVQGAGQAYLQQKARGGL